MSDPPSPSGGAMPLQAVRVVVSAVVAAPPLASPPARTAVVAGHVRGEQHGCFGRLSVWSCRLWLPRHRLRRHRRAPPSLPGMSAAVRVVVSAVVAAPPLASPPARTAVVAGHVRGEQHGCFGRLSVWSCRLWLPRHRLRRHRRAPPSLPGMSAAVRVVVSAVVAAPPLASPPARTAVVAGHVRGEQHGCFGRLSVWSCRLWLPRHRLRRHRRAPPSLPGMSAAVRVVVSAVVAAPPLASPPARTAVVAGHVRGEQHGCFGRLSVWSCRLWLPRHRLRRHRRAPPSLPGMSAAVRVVVSAVVAAPPLASPPARTAVVAGHVRGEQHGCFGRLSVWSCRLWLPRHRLRRHRRAPPSLPGMSAVGTPVCPGLLVCEWRTHICRPAAVG
ncbi:MAG: hypothetical protein WDW38_007327 [Sanguina aurantia]